MKKVLLPLALVLICFNATSQNKIDLTNFSPVTCEGKLPLDVITSSSLKIEKEIASTQIEGKRKERNKVKDFIAAANYSYDKTILSGRLLFGDPITTYLNDIAGHLLKDDPDLRSKIRIYTSKSPSVNAGMMMNGAMVINLGLVSRVQNEAELAFIIAHEISHYKLKHSLEKYNKSNELDEGKGDYKDLSLDNKIDHALKYSRKKEFEADSLGLKIFLKSKYNDKGVEGAFDVLSYDYLPFEELEFDKSFLDGEFLKIPAPFYLEKVDEVRKNENQEDKYSTHPNISKRKLRLDWKLDQGTADKVLFTIAESEFDYIRDLARFELIHSELFNRNFASCIYHAYILLQKYPDNKFLNLSVGKSLYGLSRYKNIDKYHLVAKSYNRRKGEVQQLYYILKQLNKKQLNALALSKIIWLKSKYKDEKGLDQLEADLMVDFIVLNKVRESFFGQEKDEIIIDEEEIKELSTVQLKRYYLRKYKQFYKGAFLSEHNSGYFDQYYEMAKKRTLEIQEEMAKTAKQRAKEERQKIRNTFKKGVDSEIKSIAVLNPNIFKAFNVFDVEGDDKLKHEIIEKVELIAGKKGVDLQWYHSEDLKETDINRFVKMAKLNEAIEEILFHDIYELPPLNYGLLLEVAEELGTDHICYVMVRNGFYVFVLYDLRERNMLLKHTSIIQDMGDVKSLVNKDLDIIKN